MLGVDFIVAKIYELSGPPRSWQTYKHCNVGPVQILICWLFSSRGGTERKECHLRWNTKVLGKYWQELPRGFKPY